MSGSDNEKMAEALKKHDVLAILLELAARFRGDDWTYRTALRIAT